jgi:hypothetical protein
MLRSSQHRDGSYSNVVTSDHNCHSLSWAELRDAQDDSRHTVTGIFLLLPGNKLGTQNN